VSRRSGTIVRALPAQVAPLTPSVLAWALEEAGLTTSELAARIGVGVELVVAWLEGADSPSTTHFRALAKEFNRPPTFFLQSAPPAKPAVPPSFRHFAGSATGRAFTKEETKYLRLARRMQRVVSWIRAGSTDGTKFDLPRYRTTARANVVANRLRLDLGWDIDQQRACRDAAQLLARLRPVVEDRGVLVMVVPLGRNGCQGFALLDDRAPVIAINSAQTAPARVFSLMHELAHLLLRESSFDLEYSAATETERWCEVFAATFLMPADDVRALVHRQHGGRVEDLGRAGAVAKWFRVSLTAACIRLGDLSLAPKTLTSAIPRRDDFKSADDTGRNPDPTTPATRLRELGRAAIADVIGAEESGLLRRHDVQRYLDVGATHYDNLAERIRNLSSDEDN
jgi:Zn-dependent peptidase ImmA (M78 family)/transcriptional regulator with XRE-family HTH domain